MITDLEKKELPEGLTYEKLLKAKKMLDKSEPPELPLGYITPYGIVYIGIDGDVRGETPRCVQWLKEWVKQYDKRTGKKRTIGSLPQIS